MRVTAWNTAFAILFLLFSTLSATAKTKHTQHSVECYKKHDFDQAKRKFESWVRAKPDDARAHYFLANTLTWLQDMKGAAREYQTAIENAQSDDIRENSLAALRVLQNAGIKAGDFAGSPGAGQSTARGATLSQGASSTVDVQAALQRQAEERKGLASQEVEGLRKKALEVGEQQAKQISSDHTVDPYLYRRNRFGARAYADALKKEGEQEAAAARQRAKTQAESYKRYVDEKNAALDQAATNLNDQLNQASGPSKVRLKKEGTNLNVRNYEFGQ